MAVELNVQNDISHGIYKRNEVISIAKRTNGLNEYAK